jgi:hypothetical protein
LVGAVAEIDHRQPPVTQQQRTIGPGAFVIGAAPGQTPQHPPHQGSIGFAAVEAQFTANAAHGIVALVGWAGISAYSGM